VPGGRPPLTPPQVAKLVEVYASTGNFAEAGRAIGVERNTARDAIRRVTDARRRTLHARECEKSLRKVRGYLTKTADLIHQVLVVETGAGVSLEAKDIASLSNSLSKIADTLAGIAEREDRRKGSRLTREKNRAEIEALAKGAPVRVEITDVDALRRRLVAAIADDGDAVGPRTTQ
jgi:hypothetical protein